MLSLLIDSGADVDKAIVDGQTPLCTAAWVSCNLYVYLQQNFLNSKALLCFVHRMGTLRLYAYFSVEARIRDIASREHGTARDLSERSGRVDLVLAIDRHKCRNWLVELCIGLFAADFPVLVVLEIHDVLCAISCLHEAHLGPKKEWRLLDKGHLKETVSWEIAKKVKHHLN